jgi:DNA-binding LacI/PurR family transcriptional regulator
MKPGPPERLIARSLLYEQLAERLRDFIKTEKLWGKFLPAERELARTYGVSHDTVRRGLRILAREGRVIRQHGQGTRVLPAARESRRQRSPRVLLASQWGLVAHGYAGGIMTSLGAGASEADWRVSFVDLAGADGRRNLLTTLEKACSDGLVLLSVTDESLVQAILRIQRMPIVLVDHSLPGLPVTGVRDDSLSGARQAAEHLLALGHRRIAYIDRTDRALNPWRYQGYTEALREAGIEPDGRLVVSCPTSIDDGLRVARELLGRPDPPTAVMAFDDLRALGAWRAAEARGLEVGRNFAVVGMGGQTLVSGLPVELTTVRIDCAEIGRSAVRELNGMMSGRAPGGRDVLVPVELVVGRSSRNARGPKGGSP